MRYVPPLFGPYGAGALAHVDRFEEAGANAVWFHEFDAEAFDICARHGIVPCVEFKTFRVKFGDRPDLLPIGVDGQPIRYDPPVQGVCLSKTDFLAETEARLMAGVREFRPAGIWLDYLAGAGWFETPEPDLQPHCFCAGCVNAFCEATDTDAESPAVILADHGDAWVRFNCGRVASFGARYAAIIRQALPDCIIGAYMCPWMPEEFDGAMSRIFMQDYNLLAPFIDVFTPLIYAAKCGRPPAWARLWLEGCRAFVPADRRVQLILDHLDFPASLRAAAESSVPTWGLQMFGGAKALADDAGIRHFRAAVDRIRTAR